MRSDNTRYRTIEKKVKRLYGKQVFMAEKWLFTGYLQMVRPYTLAL
jgi:hypothetical protein